MSKNRPKLVRKLRKIGKKIDIVCILKQKIHKASGDDGLPPTLRALIPHIMRSHSKTMVDKSYTNPFPNFPDLLQYGWEFSNGEISPVFCLEKPAPDSVIQLTKCSCKKSKCCTKQCSCFKFQLSCTPLCKCSDCDNIHDFTFECESDDSENELD